MYNVPIDGRELAHAPALGTLDIYGESRQSDEPKVWRIVHGEDQTIRLADCAWRYNIIMNKLIHVGFGNIVNTEKIIAIVSPDAAPIKRLVQKAKETGMAIDATQGRKTKSVLVMENNQVVLSALLPETIAGRAQEDLAPEEEKED